MAGRVFVTRQPPREVLQALEGAPEVREVDLNPHDRPVTRDELLEGVRACDVLISQLVDRIDDVVLAGNPALRLVANYAVGTDNVDTAAAAARGVPVSNTPDVLTEATADFTWALLLAVVRRVVEGDRCMRAGGFPGWSPTFMLGTEVHGKTLGIVGLGRIGAAVARRARGFGMRVTYAGPRPKPAAAALEAEHLPLRRVAGEADFVSVHTPLTPETRHLVDRDLLRAMRPGAFLVNVSRGAVVDEAALVEALRAGEIAGAALDVYEREPETAPGLTDLRNVVLAPHLGSATRETRVAMGLTCVANALDVLRGERPRNAVHRDASERGR